MKKYLLVINNSLQDYFVYRLNFILWRLRVVLSMLISYFLWTAVLYGRREVFGYGERQMITYVLLTLILSGIVFATQTYNVAADINMGRLSNYLIRPMSFFGYTIARDIADKILNTTFSLLEFAMILVILKPPVFLQSDISILFLFALAVLFAAVLYFEISLILSFIGFWSQETWAPRFLFFILVTFLAGNFFPLDIVPVGFFRILELLPFAYLVFFPLKVYLGTLTFSYLVKGFLIASGWIIVLFLLVRLLWQKGLKVYTAEGQ